MKQAYAIMPLVCLAAACGASQAEPEFQPVAKSFEAPALPEPPAADGKDPNEGTLSISDRIRSACGLNQTEAYFAFNSAQVNDEANALIRQLAACFTTGPLSGQRMRLVGHADPRGDEEYNMALGGRRAESVKRALSQASLPGEQMVTTSRGELDATGADEATWRLDRRVDVLLDE